MKQTKVLFHDADGCLNLVDGQELPFKPETLSSSEVAALAELGRCVDASSLDHLVLNTGRSWEATGFLCDAIASRKLRFALVEHGSELWDVMADQKIDFEGVAAVSGHPEALAALASTKKIRSLIRWFQDSGRQELCRRMGYGGNLTAQLDKTTNLTFLLPLELDGDQVISVLQELIASHEVFGAESLVYHHSRANRFVDVMGTMNKGIGLSLTMEHLGYDLAQSAAIGDGLNDIPMLETVAFPICPANSEDAVRKICRENGHASSSLYIGATLEWVAMLGES